MWTHIKNCVPSSCFYLKLTLITKTDLRPAGVIGAHLSVKPRLLLFPSF